MRHRGGNSSLGLELSRLFFSDVLSSKNRPRWRIGNNINECSLCGKCELICRSGAIAVSQSNRTWTLNNRRCSQCLNCIVTCPKRCLSQVRV